MRQFRTQSAAENDTIYAMKTTCTMPSANGVGAVKIEKILDEDLVFMALIVNT